MSATEFMAMAMEIAKAQAGVKAMTPVELGAYVHQVAEELAAAAAGGTVETAPKLVCDPATAIRDKTVTCCVTGKQFKIITKRYLATIGHTPESYRDLCGYKRSQSLICKDLQKTRRKKMQDMKLWEKRSDAAPAAAPAPKKPEPVPAAAPKKADPAPAPKA